MCCISNFASLLFHSRSFINFPNAIRLNSASSICQLLPPVPVDGCFFLFLDLIGVIDEISGRGDGAVWMLPASPLQNSFIMNTCPVDTPCKWLFSFWMNCMSSSPPSSCHSGCWVGVCVGVWMGTLLKYWGHLGQSSQFQEVVWGLRLGWKCQFRMVDGLGWGLGLAVSCDV